MVLIMVQGQINWIVVWIYAPRHAASNAESEVMSVEKKRVQSCMHASNIVGKEHY